MSSYPHAFPTLPPQWFASTNGGQSAFSVRATDQRGAIGEAVCRLYDRLRDADGHVDPATFDAEIAPLQVYSESEWDAHCLKLHAADKLARVLAAQAINQIDLGAA